MHRHRCTDPRVDIRRGIVPIGGVTFAFLAGPNIRFVLIVMLAAAAWGRGAEPPPPLAPAGTSEVVSLPRFEVREKSVTDFGMSVVTNFGVLFGRKIAWMRVGTVVPGSSASLAGLKTDDVILALDEHPVNEIGRAAMLETFFNRPFGARVKLLVRDTHPRRYRMVELTAGAVRRK